MRPQTGQQGAPGALHVKAGQGHDRKRLTKGSAHHPGLRAVNNPHACSKQVSERALYILQLPSAEGSEFENLCKDLGSCMCLLFNCSEEVTKPIKGCLAMKNK